MRPRQQRHHTLPLALEVLNSLRVNEIAALPVELPQQIHPTREIGGQREFQGIELLGNERQGIVAMIEGILGIGPFGARLRRNFEEPGIVAPTELGGP